VRSIPLLAILLAGVIHLLVAPEHYNHSMVHGIFFAGVGLAEIGWALALWRRPTAGLFRLGVALAGGLVILWTLTRILPAPFGHGPEAVNISGLVCKASELLGLVTLAMLALQGRLSGVEGRAAPRLVGEMLALPVIVGLALFGAGHAAAMVLPAEWAHTLGAEEHVHEPGTEEHVHATESAPTSQGRIVKADHLQIEGVWARPAPAGGTTAVYLTIVNTGEHADALIAVQSEAAEAAELHETRMEGDVMRMRPVARLAVPAGGRVEIKPGGYHIMLTRLKHPLVAGEHVPVVLQFEQSGQVVVEADVGAP